MKIKSLIILFILLSIDLSNVFAQVRDYRIHQRGMLHETVFNDGSIGRAWLYGSGGEKVNLPCFEWPPRSKTIINGIEYSGQHNIIGAGIYIVANEKGNPGTPNRLYSFCGAIGTGSGPELPIGRWSFPISIEKIENYPLLADGSLNPNYNPDEAEEIIINKFSTSLGITVTRTSRAWSYPDYDDMIIYEYELEYTGDTNGDLSTIERTTDLVDIIFTVNYGFSPSMLGYQRNYGEWKYEGGMYRGDNRHTFDPDYWLTYSQTTQTGAADQGIENLFAKPEPNKDLFLEFSRTGLNGGGLLSPQAPGYCMLYWDIDHLAIIDPLDPSRNESEYINYMLKDANGNYFETDQNDHILQPWQRSSGSGDTRPTKIIDRQTIRERYGLVYGQVGPPPGSPSDGGRYLLPGGRTWKGRAGFEWYQCHKVAVFNGFGPYVMKLGDKLEFAYAEVVGYGGTTGKVACGGQTDVQFYPIRSMNRKVVLNGETVTEHYLDEFGYPDYINSDVVSVDQVAHNAWETYLGTDIPYDSTRKGPAGGMLFPELNPKPSANTNKYKIPVTVPAPIIIVENTSSATVKIDWNTNAEQFTHPRLTGTIQGYKIWRSDYGMGPWKLIGELQKGQVNNEGLYEFVDEDETYRLGEGKYYSITSVDNNGEQSGKTNITFHVKNVKSVDKLGNVYAVPNPFVVKSGFVGQGQENAIGFYGLPEKCTIRIYSYAGQLVEMIEHDSPTFSVAWFQVTRNDQDVASGVYFYVVSTPEGEQSTGKFVIIK